MARQSLTARVEAMETAQTGFTARLDRIETLLFRVLLAVLAGAGLTGGGIAAAFGGS